MSSEIRNEFFRHKTWNILLFDTFERRDGETALFRLNKIMSAVFKFCKFSLFSKILFSRIFWVATAVVVPCGLDRTFGYDW